MSIDCRLFLFSKCFVDDDDSSEKNDDELDIENQNQNLAEDRADDEDDESDDNEDEGKELRTKILDFFDFIHSFQLSNFLDDEEDEDDVIQMPLRSYVESNEEMTESDCNVHEDDERTGEHLFSCCFFSSCHQR